ncbi:MAG: hemolysin family protein, partial [Planctomycetota bacterium]
MLTTYSLIIKFTLLAVSFALSAFFSGSETALFGLPSEEVEELEETSAGRAVAHLLQNPRRLLSTILLGNNLVNVLYFSVSFMLVLRYRDYLGTWLTVTLTVVSPLSMIIFCEVLPKTAAVSYRRRWSRLAAPPLYYCQRVLWPFIRGLELLADTFTNLTGGQGTEKRITAEELHMLIQHSKREGGLDIDLGEMMGGVLALSEMEVDELMVPRVEMVSFEVDGNPDDLLHLFRREKLTVIPVYEDHMDNVIGAVHIKDLLFRHTGEDLRSIARKVPFVPETASGEDLLHRFRQEETKTALVIDEYGGLRGLVTIEDILEEIVGEITDEYE